MLGAYIFDCAKHAPAAPNDGSYVLMRFAPQATLGAYKAKVVDGPLNMGSPFYRIRLCETKLPTKIIRQMQLESKIVDFIVAQE
jgi:hypothetical protein